LPGGTSAGPGEVSFAAHGEVLVVTEKGTNLIDTFRLDWRGRPTLASSTASGGNTPFGFSVTHSKNLIVADAGSGAVSSYKLREDGSLQTIDAAVSLNGQTASCWLVTTANGRFAFTGDAGSEAISALSVSPSGNVALLKGVAASTNGAALDLGFTEDGRFLYVRSAQGANASLPGTVSGFKVGQDGSLTAVNSLSNLPAGADGIAVR
jgi:6-phosphogluconolactonase